MTEGEARQWIIDRWGMDAAERLECLAQLVVSESRNQNLVAPSTLGSIWSRHFVDSAQLIPFAPADAGRWADVGTGAGFPGLVIAILRGDPVVLIEPRARRCDFLERCVEALELQHATVHCGKAESVALEPFDVISARAVASVEMLLGVTRASRLDTTTLLFPRGRGGRDELANLDRRWQKLFHVEQSVTDPESVILVANGAM